MKTYHVFYLIKQFPRISETFIMNEIINLIDNGCQVTIVSLLNASQQNFYHENFIKYHLIEKTIYLDDLELSSKPHKTPFSGLFDLIRNKQLNFSGKIELLKLYVTKQTYASKQTYIILPKNQTTC